MYPYFRVLIILVWAPRTWQTASTHVTRTYVFSDPRNIGKPEPPPTQKEEYHSTAESMAKISTVGLAKGTACGFCQQVMVVNPFTYMIDS